jgi:hypothetical protein
MAEIITAVTSIDQLATYKFSDDLLLELVSVTATVEHDPESAATESPQVAVVEPLSLIKHQPPSGYLLENRRVQLTCAKSAGVCLGDRIKFRILNT